MNRKTHKTKQTSKQKMMDVSKPRKTSPAAASPQLVIPSRPILGRTITVSGPVDDDARTEPTTAPPLVPPNHTVIAPPKAKPTNAPAKSEVSKQNPTPDKPPRPTEGNPSKPPTVSAPPVPSAKEVPAPPVPVDPPEAKTQGSASASAAKVEENSDESEEDAASTAPADKPAQPTQETQKAVEEAALATKRERELEALIDSRQFNVPINAVARKRSIKVSAVLTVLVFLLALVLIDLMLDTGIILLVQKIPHTHFFTSISN